MRHHKGMEFRLSPIVFCCALALGQTMQMNDEQLAEFIRSELALKQHTDKQIAAYLKKVQLTEKLTDKMVTDLEAQGAGPKTVEALEHLRDETANMKPPRSDVTYSPATVPDTSLSRGQPTITLSAKPAPIPPPNSIRQQQILDAMKQYAMSYTENLPNFICVRVDRRYVDPRGGDSLRSIGTVLAKVSYNERQEKYKVYSVNGKIVDTDMGGIGGGGARSTGEFAEMMRSIFEPKSEADFGWDHWATLRGRRMAVFNYFIDSGHSSYSIGYGENRDDEQRIITAYRGLIYADPNTGEIDRITFVAVDIPKSFPVTEAKEILDYDLVDISGQQYVLPLRAQLTMRARGQFSKNEIEFRNYRKFGSEANIIYAGEAPPPLPQSQTEEQPAAASSAPAKPAQPASAKNATGPAPWQLPTPPPPPPK